MIRFQTCLSGWLMLIALSFPLAATAIPVHWTVEGVVFEDGGTASGSFTYDADFNLYSSISLDTTDGAWLSGNSYHATAAYLFGHIGVVFVPTPGSDVAGTQFLQLGFTIPLSNAGGLVPLGENHPPTGAAVVEGFCNGLYCQPVTGPMRYAVQNGTATGVVVPVPSGLWLLGSALGLLKISRVTKLV